MKKINLHVSKIYCIKVREKFTNFEEQEHSLTILISEGFGEPLYYSWGWRRE